MEYNYTCIIITDYTGGKIPIKQTEYNFTWPTLRLLHAFLDNHWECSESKDLIGNDEYKYEYEEQKKIKS